MESSVAAQYVWKYRLVKNLPVLIVVLLVVGYELFNFTLTLAEELTSLMKAKELTIYTDLGRWGTYWLNRLLIPESVLPFLPTLTGLISLARSAFLFILIPQSDFKNDSILLSMPTWPHTGSVQRIDETTVVKLSDPIHKTW